MVKLKPFVDEERICYEIHISLSDIIEDEKDYDRLIRSVVRRAKDGLDRKGINRLLADAQKILQKVRGIRSLMPKKLYAFFQEIFLFLNENRYEVLDYDRNKEFFINVRQEIERLRKDLSSQGKHDRKAAVNEKPYEVLFKLFASDLGLFKGMDKRAVQEMDYARMLDHLYDIAEHESGIMSKVGRLVHAMLDAIEEDLNTISTEEARKLFQMKKLEDYLESLEFRHSDFVEQTIQAISRIKQEYKLELSQDIIDDQKLREIEWQLSIYEKEYEKRSPKIGYHNTNAVAVQFAIINNYMFGPKGIPIYCCTNNKDVPSYRREHVVDMISKELEQKGLKPIDRPILLEFDLRKIRTVMPAMHGQAISHLVRTNGALPKDYPWVQFDGPVKLTECLTAKSMIDIKELEREMERSKAL